MLALLPRRWSPVPTPGQPALARATWLEGVIEYRKTILAITAVLIVVALWGAVHVGFDYNMLKLQAKGVESVAWEERILTRAGRAGVTALATATGLEQLRRKRDAFRPAVGLAGRERPDAGVQKNLPPRTIVPGDAPPELRHRYVGSSGRYLLRIQPAVDIWQREGAERFVTDVRRIDPDVTGPPITSYEAIRFIQHGYFQGTLSPCCSSCSSPSPC